MFSFWSSDAPDEATMVQDVIVRPELAQCFAQSPKWRGDVFVTWAAPHRGGAPAVWIPEVPGADPVLDGCLMKALGGLNYPATKAQYGVLTSLLLRGERGVMTPLVGDIATPAQVQAFTADNQRALGRCWAVAVPGQASSMEVYIDARGRVS